MCKAGSVTLISRSPNPSPPCCPALYSPASRSLLPSQACIPLPNRSRSPNRPQPSLSRQNRNQRNPSPSRSQNATPSRSRNQNPCRFPTSPPLPRQNRRPSPPHRRKPQHQLPRLHRRPSRSPRKTNPSANRSRTSPKASSVSTACSACILIPKKALHGCSSRRTRSAPTSFTSITALMASSLPGTIAGATATPSFSACARPLTASSSSSTTLRFTSIRRTPSPKQSVPTPAPPSSPAKASSLRTRMAC